MPEQTKQGSVSLALHAQTSYGDFLFDEIVKGGKPHTPSPLERVIDYRSLPPMCPVTYAEREQLTKIYNEVMTFVKEKGITFIDTEQLHH